MNVPVSVNATSSTTAIFYEITTTNVDDSELMSYTTYGILAKSEDGETLAAFPDVSTSRDYVEKFVDMIKDRGVAAIHIADLLEDYLD